MYVHTLHIGETHKLGELFDLRLSLLCRAESLAQHIENVGGGGCGDQALGIAFNGLSQRPVGICERCV